MISKKKGVIIASIVTVLSFISIFWISCSKSSRNSKSCQGIVCANGGVCDTGICHCPTGYEGPRCANGFVEKFVGTWDVKQKIIGSDSAHLKGNVLSYVAFVKKSATPTAFFIDNFFGDANYNNILCSVDSADTHKFRMDTLSAFHMLYDHFRVLQFSGGDITSRNDSISAVIRVKHLTSSVNWQTDTLHILMTKHNF